MTRHPFYTILNCGFMICLLFTISCSKQSGVQSLPATDINEQLNIVSMDGVCTEILFAMGLGDKIIARDESSHFPSDKTPTIQNMGKSNNIGVEAILQYKPTHVVQVDHPMRKALTRQIQESGAQLISTPYAITPEEGKERIRIIAKAFGKQLDGEKIIDRINEGLNQLEDKVKARAATGKPRVKALFLLFNGDNASVLGKNGAPARFITLCGADYAFDSDTSPKAVSPEALISIQPEVIVCYSDRLDRFGGIESVLKLPGMDMTPAGKNKRVIALDSLLCGGFGPRMGEGGLELFHALYDVEGLYLSGKSEP